LRQAGISSGEASGPTAALASLKPVIDRLCNDHGRRKAAPYSGSWLASVIGQSASRRRSFRRGRGHRRFFAGRKRGESSIQSSPHSTISKASQLRAAKPTPQKSTADIISSHSPCDRELQPRVQCAKVPGRYPQKRGATRARVGGDRPPAARQPAAYDCHNLKASSINAETFGVALPLRSLGSPARLRRVADGHIAVSLARAAVRGKNGAFHNTMPARTVQKRIARTSHAREGAVSKLGALLGPLVPRGNHERDPFKWSLSNVLLSINSPFGPSITVLPALEIVACDVVRPVGREACGGARRQGVVSSLLRLLNERSHARAHDFRAVP
jgi:hypothetical protein